MTEETTPSSSHTAAQSSDSPSDSPSDGTVRCALTGKEISRDEAYWAPPLVTTQELISTIFTTLTHTPSNLGQVLMGEQPDVPYAPEARDELAKRRTTEQFKLLLLLLLIALVVVLPIYLLLS